MKRISPRSVLSTALAAALTATVLSGCSVGPGEDVAGSVRLTVTSDFGAKTIARASERSAPGGETVMRFLARKAKVETRYGGRFVNAVDGLRSRDQGRRRQDWFYYVNGIEAETGAAERALEAGDRIWWDYRDWTAAMRVPAVVGSFPEPFVHGSEGKRFPVRIDCAQEADETCVEVAERLERAGIGASTTALGAPVGKEVLRLVVGEWSDVRRDGATRQIEEGPAQSGVFARFVRANRGYALELLDSSGKLGGRSGAGAGLVAATRFEQQQPTWIVAGTDRTGLERAVALLDERILRDRYAVAGSASKTTPLPLRDGEATR